MCKLTTVQGDQKGNKRRDFENSETTTPCWNCFNDSRYPLIQGAAWKSISYTSYLYPASAFGVDDATDQPADIPLRWPGAIDS